MSADSAIVFHCPSCNASLSAKKELAGRKASCPNCQQPVVVPQKEPGPA